MDSLGKRYNTAVLGRGSVESLGWSKGLRPSLCWQRGGLAVWAVSWGGRFWTPAGWGACMDAEQPGSFGDKSYLDFDVVSSQFNSVWLTDRQEYWPCAYKECWYVLSYEWPRSLWVYHWNVRAPAHDLYKNVPVRDCRSWWEARFILLEPSLSVVTYYSSLALPDMKAFMVLPGVLHLQIPGICADIDLCDRSSGCPQFRDCQIANRCTGLGRTTAHTWPCGPVG